MRRNFEKTQKGNPHKLTIGQHIWPRRSIERFTGPTGRVNLFDKVRNKVRMAAPGDDVFCTKRAWDQKAEVSTKSIEDDFQNLAEEIIAGRVTDLDTQRKVIVDLFYALWRARAELRSVGADPISSKNVTGHNWTQDEEERFEKHGVSFLRVGGFMPDRFDRGRQIWWEIDRIQIEISDGQWGITHAQAGQFLVPDYPGLHPVIPLTPVLCLWWGQTGTRNIPWHLVAEINQHFRSISREYFFAKDLTQTI
jgi:hypothetical protein